MPKSVPDPGKVFTDLQPMDGDGCLSCAHIDPRDLLPDQIHWFILKDLNGGPRLVARSDGAEFHVSWLLVCGACFARYDDPEEAAARDFVWDTRIWGPGPVIEKVASQ